MTKDSIVIPQNIEEITWTKKLGDFEFVHSDLYRDGEDSYEDLVIRDTVTGKLYKLTTYYSSWDGTDWSDAECFEVEEKQKTITVYEPVPGTSKVDLEMEEAEDTEEEDSDSWSDSWES